MVKLSWGKAVTVRRVNPYRDRVDPRREDLPDLPNPAGHQRHLAYRLTSRQNGTLQVGGDSPDGSNMGPVSNIPVVLDATGG